MTKKPSSSNQGTGQFWETVPSFIPPEYVFLYKLAVSPTGLGILVCAILLLIVAKPTKNKKGVLASAYFADDREIKAAKRASKKMLKTPKRDAAALWIGLPPEYSSVLNALQKVIYKHKTLYFNAQTGTLVLGGAGTGKSYSAIMTMVLSILKQGFPMSFYDFKYPEAAEDVISNGLAEDYDVSVFAPGFPESSCLNLLDFLRDSSDGLAAKQVAKVIVKNVNGNSAATGDSFFEPAGIQLVTGLLQAGKWVGEITNDPDNADLMTCSAILSLSNLASRIEYSFHKLDVWVANAFAQLIGSHSGQGTNNTESGIVATAQKVFSAIIQAEFISAICGKSDFKIDIRGKTLVVFGLNQKYRYAVSPFLAAAMDMIMDRNLDHSLKRKDPIANVLDELPSLYLEKIVNYLAEARSAGHIGIIGGQSYFQFEKMFGKELTNVIFANCSNKILLNPQEFETAEMFSKILGDKDVTYKTSSVTHSKSDRSRQTTENITTVRLLPPEKILQFPRGEGLVINPLFKRGRSAYLPLHHRFKIPRYETQEVKRNKTKYWQKSIDYMRGGERLSSEEAGRMLSERIRLVSELLPEPPVNAVSIPVKSLVQIAQNYKLRCTLPASLSLETMVKISPDLVSDDDRVTIPNIATIQGLLTQFGIKFSCANSSPPKMGQGRLQDFAAILSEGAFNVDPPSKGFDQDKLYSLPLDDNSRFEQDGMIGLLRSVGFSVTIQKVTLPSRIPSP